MKNAARIRKQTATNPANSQRRTEDTVPTLAISAHFKRGGKVHNQCLIPDIGISSHEWELACKQDIHQRNAGQGGFFAQAIREKLSIPSGAEWSAVLELEAATNQSNGLAQLLFDTLQNQSTEGKQANGAVLAGVSDLVKQTADRLANAQAALTDIITTRRKGAEIKAASAN